MVVRCSLLGHDFGEPEVEREREERGSEVVVTVEEYEECARCGSRNVLSENTEVKSLGPEPAPESESTPDPESAPESESPTPGPETTADGADPSVDSSPPPTDGEPVETDTEEPAVPTDEAGEPITDDAEILDAEATEPEPASERDHGEWPDSDDVGRPADQSAEPTAWPDSDEPDGQPDERSGDAQLIDAEAESTADVEEGESPTTDAQQQTTDRDPGSGIASAGEAPTPGESSTRDGGRTEFFCPRCSYVASDDRGSLRPGDICPECKKGYLGERER